MKRLIYILCLFSGCVLAATFPTNSPSTVTVTSSGIVTNPANFWSSNSSNMVRAINASGIQVTNVGVATATNAARAAWADTATMATNALGGWPVIGSLINARWDGTNYYYLTNGYAYRVTGNTGEGDMVTFWRAGSGIAGEQITWTWMQDVTPNETRVPNLISLSGVDTLNGLSINATEVLGAWYRGTNGPAWRIIGGTNAANLEILVASSNVQGSAITWTPYKFTTSATRTLQSLSDETIITKTNIWPLQSDGNIAEVKSGGQMYLHGTNTISNYVWPWRWIDPYNRIGFAITDARFPWINSEKLLVWAAAGDNAYDQMISGYHLYMTSRGGHIYNRSFMFEQASMDGVEFNALDPTGVFTLPAIAIPNRTSPAPVLFGAVQVNGNLSVGQTPYFSTPQYGPSGLNALNDVSVSGSFTGRLDGITVRLEIVSAGSPDTYRWAVRYPTYFDTWHTNPIVAGPVHLTNGISITFTNTSGHTVQDVWDVWGSPGGYNDRDNSNAAQVNVHNAGGNILLGVESSAGSSIIPSTGPYDPFLYTSGADNPIRIGINGALTTTISKDGGLNAVGTLSGLNISITNDFNGITNLLSLYNTNNSAASNGPAILLSGTYKHATISSYADPNAVNGGNLQISSLLNGVPYTPGIFMNVYGDIGLGTTNLSHAYICEVGGDLNARGLLTGTNGLVFNSTNQISSFDGSISATNGNLSVSGTYAGKNLILTNNADNGQGINSHVNGTVGGLYAGVFTSDGVGAENHGVQISATNGILNYGLSIADISAGPTNWSIYSSAPAQSFIAGNVGIGPGMTNPDTNLVVAGEAWMGSLLVTNRITSDNYYGKTAILTNLSDGFIPYHVTDALGLTNSVMSQSGVNVSIDGGLHVGGTGAAGDNNLLVDGTSYFTGNVTVGPVSPSGIHSFEVANSYGDGQGVTVTLTGVSGGCYAGNFNATGASPASNYGLNVSAANGDQNRSLNIAGPSAAPLNWCIYESGTAQNYFAGNVGIGQGNTNPGTNLVVAGEAWMGSLYVSNTISADNYVTFSVAPASESKAIEMVKSVSAKNGVVNHEKLDPDLWGKKVSSYVDNGKTRIEIASEPDGKKSTNIVKVLDPVITPNNHSLNLGMLVSALALDNQAKQRQIDDLLKRVEALEKAK